MSLKFDEDMFTQIVRIVANRGIAVLSLSYTSNVSTAWVFVLSGVPTDLTHQYFLPNLSRDTGYIPVTSPSGLIVQNPISSDMSKRGLVWSFPSAAEKSLTFFNVKLLTKDADYTFSVVAPPSIPLDPGIVYWLWGSDFGAASLADNQAHPFTTGDPISGGIMSLPRGFTTQAARDAYLALGVATWFGETTTNPIPAKNVNWTMRLATYRRKNFLVSGLATPAWPDKPVSQTSQSASAETTGSEVIFTIKKNLQVSSSKVPHSSG